MSKLYEALENASREREKLENAKTSVIRPFGPPTRNDDLEIMSLYGAINAALGKKTSRVVQFIGTQPGEGCSTITHELAAAAASRLEETVLLLDLDFHNSLADGETDRTILSHLETPVLAAPAENKAFCETEREGFTFGSFSPNCDPVVALYDMAHDEGSWKLLRERFTLILVDAPPVSISPMGFSLLSRTDGVVLVVRAEKTRCPEAVNLKERISREGGKVVGAIYNDRRHYAPRCLRRYL